MHVIKTKIDGLLIFEPKVFADARGFFLESYNQQRFREATGLDVQFVQDNHSRSIKNTLRGLHYQENQPQGKLVRVTLGEVYDVAVDIRPGSATYGQWEAFHLTAENKRQVWIPPGMAHGFLVTSDSAEFLYKTTDYYAPKEERSLRWNDPFLAIPWPLDGEPLLSEKDKVGLTLDSLKRASSR